MEYGYSAVYFVLALISTINGAPHRMSRSSYSSYDCEELMSDMRELNKYSPDLIEEPLFDTSANFHRAFNFAGSVDGKFKYLPGYTREDIQVETIGNVIPVEAMHKSLWSYSDYYFETFTVPNGVSTEGTWEFQGGVLTLELAVSHYALPVAHPTKPKIAPTISEKSFAEPNEISTTPEDTTSNPEITTEDEATKFVEPVFKFELPETTTIEEESFSTHSKIEPTTSKLVPEEITTESNINITDTLKDTIYEYYDDDEELVASKHLTLEITTKSLVPFNRVSNMLYPENEKDQDNAIGDQMEYNQDEDPKTQFEMFVTPVFIS